MFWNRKKKEDPTEEKEENELFEDTADGETEEDDVREEYAEEDEDGEDEVTEEDEIPDVTVKIDSFDALMEFVTERKASGLQFMNKMTHEAFELRESHIRIAGVWGSVSMSRECSPLEYAKIMLATELTEAPDRFYVLPALSEKEAKQAVVGFCKERYNENGKKYASAPKKFIDLVESNGDEEEWKAYVKAAMYDKLKAFCEENGIEF